MIASLINALALLLLPHRYTQISFIIGLLFLYSWRLLSSRAAARETRKNQTENDTPLKMCNSYKFSELKRAHQLLACLLLLPRNSQQQQQLTSSSQARLTDTRHNGRSVSSSTIQRRVSIHSCAPCSFHQLQHENCLTNEFSRR